ncbi:putative Sodium/hydrogen exchanger [Streptomyces viridochromogenes Tue57]|uniref:Putative Sodium/hydrogen exchanger n=1 Tax=Streptomyces viridochromogenes Tue57 TaxID=1160705 RepID=L8PMC1_STRVR|nr:putative Sodium/hydrogen exchanger [Streptomyces viridochromogenes Tue57]
MEKTITRMVAGASLKPDSASSRPVTFCGSRSERRTAKTAAASVEAMIAPSSSAGCHSMPGSQCTPAAVTTTDTATPTVASTPAGARGCLVSLHRVVRPPSVIEVQADDVLTGDHTDGEEQQQAGHTDAVGGAGRGDAGRQHRAGDQQCHVQLLRLS